MMECVNSQRKKRTKLIPVFPSEASLLRLLTARLMDHSDEWEDNRAPAGLYACPTLCFGS